MFSFVYEKSEILFIDIEKQTIPPGFRIQNHSPIIFMHSEYFETENYQSQNILTLKILIQS